MNTSALSKVIKEVSDLADTHARLQISDWIEDSPIRMLISIKDQCHEITRRKYQPRTALIRLAMLCIVGAWILDLEGGQWPARK